MHFKEEIPPILQKTPAKSLKKPTKINKKNTRIPSPKNELSKAAFSKNKDFHLKKAENRSKIQAENGTNLQES